MGAAAASWLANKGEKEAGVTPQAGWHKHVLLHKP